MNANQLERFFSKVVCLDDEDGGCWQWTAAISNSGYGMLGAGRSWRSAHRLSYEHFVGPIPSGMTIDHLCRNRACANPDHLESVTNRENILRGTGASARCARKTHCDHGHEFTPENTSYQPARPGVRVCRTCSREKAQRERDTNGDHVRALRNKSRPALRARRTPEEKARDNAIAAQRMRDLRARRRQVAS